MLRNRAAALLVLSLSCHTALGLGIGTLEPLSALNEPFNARIEILGATATDFDTLRVGLAGEQQFERAGVDRAGVLLKLSFKIVQTPAGADYIQISSKDPIREPFLNFLLEMQWARGRLVREYTVLLDPPLYDRAGRAAQVSAPRVPPTAPRATPPAAPTPAVEPTPARAAGAPPALVAGGDIGPVQTGDTLWSLASAYRPDQTVTIQQMMLALLRANPEAFRDGNINMLNRGAVMRIPDRAEITQLSPGEAFAEVKRQHQLWEEYRQRIAATVAEQPLGAVAAAAPATPEAAPEDAEARLELAAPSGEGLPGVPGAGVREGGELSLLREQLDAGAQANTELRAKLDEADEIIDLLQRQVEIKDDELAALQARLAELGIDLGDIGPGEAAPEAVPEAPEAMEPQEPLEPEGPGLAVEELDITLGEAPAPAQPQAAVEEPAPPAPVAPPEPAAGGPLSGLIPDYIADVVPGGVKTVLGVIGAVVLLLVGLIAKSVMAGREKPVVTPAVAEAAGAETEMAIGDFEEEEEPITAPRDEETERADVTALPESELATLEATAAELRGEPEADPLEEVNVYLAYERFDQAEELVKKVIDEHPDEHKYKLRLLEVYYSANNKKEYEQAARTLHDAVGSRDPLWKSAVAMWAEMSPGRGLFEKGGEELATGVEAAASKEFVDITSFAEPDRDRTMAMAPGHDKGLAATHAGVDEAEEETGLDFDISAGPGDESEVIDLTAGPGDGEELLDMTTPAEEAEGELEILDLTTAGDEAPGDFADESEDEGVLDLTAAEPGKSDVPAQSAELLDITHTGDVPLGRQHEDLLNVTSPGLGDLEEVLDLTQEETPEAEESVFDITGESDQAPEALDFDVGAPAELPPDQDRAAATKPPLELAEDEDTGEISLDFDSDAETTPRLETGEAGTAADDQAIEFDIESFGLEETADEGERAEDELLDLELGDTGDLSRILAETAEQADEDLEEPLAFDLSDTGELPGDETTDLELSPEEGAESDFGLSLQDETDDFGLAEAVGMGDDSEAEIEFDLALQDTTDMDALGIEDTLELPKSGDDTGEGMVDAGDESLEDLTQSMEEAIAGLDLEEIESPEIELEPEEAAELGKDHLETVALDKDAAKEQRRLSEQTVAMPRDEDVDVQSDVDETDTKLNLAKAYIELGDKDGARSILDEVADDGTEEQKAEARQLLDQL